jgi:transcriptional regulator with XRE-family HTH domain
MATLQELRLQARLSVSRLARLADVDRQAVVRAERGEQIRDVTAYAIVSTLAKVLQRDIKLADVDGLNIL